MIRPKSAPELRVVAEEVLAAFFHPRQERLFDFLVGQHVIRGNAGLARVVEFSPDDATGGDVEIGVPIDDAGALAAKLERDRGQMPGRGGSSRCGRRCSPPVIEDVIEPLFEQSGCFRGPSLDDLHAGRVQIIGQGCGDQARWWRERARLV